jgi:hypothetical protein
MLINSYRYANAAFTPASLPSIYAYYDPTDISTLWQDSARTTPVTTHGDPVGCIDDISGNGHHLLQATSTARGLWQSTGGVLMDNVDDYYREATTTMQTLTLPLYQALAWDKTVAASNIVQIQSNGSGTDHFYLAGNSANGSDNTKSHARLRTSVLGSVNAESGTGQWAIGDAAVVDSLAVPGTHDVQINNNTRVSVANTWTETSQLVDARIAFSSGAFAQKCFGGLFLGYIVARADPDAMRADAKNWLAARAGISI